MPAESDGRAALTIAELAIRLRVSRSYIEKRISAGEIPVFRVGRAVRISPTTADAILASGLP